MLVYQTILNFYVTDCALLITELFIVVNRRRNDKNVEYEGNVEIIIGFGKIGLGVRL